MTDRTQLVSRIQAYFHLISDERSSADSFWANIDSKQRGASQEVVLTGSVAEIAEMPADSTSNSLFYGFDSLHKEQYERLRGEPSYLAAGSCPNGKPYH